MYTRILVPVDGSHTALKGLAEALKLAKVSQAEIRLVHVVNELIHDPTATPSVYYEHSTEHMRESGRKALRNAQALARQHDIEIQVELVEMPGIRACDCIVTVAKRWGADLIVMGTHGRSGVKRFAIGSDAESVLRLAHVPVLVVRDAAAIANNR